MMRHRIATGIAAGLLVLTAPTTPAAAAPDQANRLGECPGGAVCFWQYPHYQGEMTTVQPTSDCQQMPGQRVRSIFNNSDSTVVLFGDGQCKFKEDTVWPGDLRSYIDPMGSWLSH